MQRQRRMFAAFLIVAIVGTSFPVTVAAAAPTPVVLYRVNAGGDAVTATPAWQKDTSRYPSQYTNARSAVSVTDNDVVSIDMTDASLPAGISSVIFRTKRVDTAAGSAMSWNFPVSPGRYLVRMFFAETDYSVAGLRTFSVSIEGQSALQNFDIFASAGKKNKGIMRAFTVQSDGVLSLDFVRGKNDPVVNAIEIVSAQSNQEVSTTILSSAGGEGEGTADSHIDVAVMYDSYARQYAESQGKTMQTLLTEDFQYLNAAMVSNSVHAVFHLVHSEEVDLGGTQLTSVADYVGHFDPAGFDQPKIVTAADLFFLYTYAPQFRADPICATSKYPWKGQLPYADKAFFMMSKVECRVGRQTAIVHEVGHLLGAGHQDAAMTAEQKAGMRFPYARAHIGTFDNRGTRYTYGTIEFDAQAGDRDFRLTNNFSQPAVARFTLPNGDKVDVSLGSADENNVLVMNQIAVEVAAYRTAIKDPGLGIMNLIPGSTLSYVMEGVRPMQANSWKVVGSSNGSFYTAEFTLSPSGTITGTAKTPGTATFTVQATDLNGAVHERTVSFKISPSPLQNQTWREDVNGDTRLTDADTTMIDSFLVANGEKRVTGLSASVVGYLDANGDGWINSADAVLVRSTLRLDVNHDGLITPLDALININYLNVAGPTVLSSPTPAQAAELAKNPSYTRDVNNDGQITALDVLMLINYLNALSPQ